MTEGDICTLSREGNRNSAADAPAPARNESFPVLKPSCHIHRSLRAGFDSAPLLKMASAGSGCNVKKPARIRVRRTNVEPRPHISVTGADNVAFIRPLNVVALPLRTLQGGQKLPDKRWQPQTRQDPYQDGTSGKCSESARPSRYACPSNLPLVSLPRGRLSCDRSRRRRFDDPHQVGIRGCCLLSPNTDRRNRNHV